MTHNDAHHTDPVPTAQAQSRLSIRIAQSPSDIAACAHIFRAYAKWIESTLAYSLDNQGFETELASLPGRYGPPRGLLMLAVWEENPVGAIGLYEWGQGIAELKRLYMLPEAAGHGIGARLFDAVLRAARDMGYQEVRLDTLKRMEHARRIYAHYPFVEIAPYNDYHGDTEDVIHLSLTLSKM